MVRYSPPSAASTSGSAPKDTWCTKRCSTTFNWLEGHPNVPLRECRVTAINDPSSSPVSSSTLETVYVDVACPNAK